MDAQVRTVYGGNGLILSQDTLSLPDGLMALYKPGMGFLTQRYAGMNSDTLLVEFRNSEGQTTSDWAFPSTLFGLFDVEQDRNGWWYFSFGDAVHIYSPQRELMGLVPLNEDGDTGLLLSRNGSMYYQTFNRLSRIRSWR